MSKGECMFNGDSLEVVWKKLGDVPCDNNSDIDGEFYDYPLYTAVEDIWHDIEEVFDVSVGDLMFGDSTTN